VNQVRSTREALGLRQEDLAARADISYSYVRRLEAGTSDPTITVARRIADALNSTIDQLFPAAGNLVVRGKKRSVAA
jgi:putative transcriptional regulator